jgi:AAA15 family ATPase/GTPase
MIKLIYYFNNQNKKVILITKHKKSIHESLIKYKISENIFSEIIHIEKNDKKYNYMDANGSIFIDDSFFERKEVKDNLDIPVFSVDSINCLW